MTRYVDTPCTAPLRASELTVGDQVLERTVRLTRADLIAYAGASGDHNPIHWSDRIASEVGLPGVLAHGMLTMGQAASCVASWAGDPARVVALATRFSAPVVVPDPGEAVLTVAASVKAIEGDQVTLALSVTQEGASKPVLGRATAVVDLSEGRA
ncbi:MaoC/PaaZ C-terminal domain-containing protein [Kytococcus sedentarius]|uniref:MaoC/PaaZ C-terminal domain-containing protein n=1 Tax=Kytococcus sedentarius TaxID=1276 RepID=UPI0035BC396E